MRSLRGRLTLGITLVLAVVLAGAGVMVSRYVDRSERDALDDRLKATAELSRETALAAVQRSLPSNDRRLDQVLSASGTSLRVLLERSVLLESGRAPEGARPAPRDGLRTFSADGRRYRSYAVSLERAELGGLARLEVTTSLGPLESRLSALNRRLLGIGIGALLVLGAGVWFVATLLLQPAAPAARCDGGDRRHRGSRPCACAATTAPRSCARWRRASTTCSRGSGARRPIASARWRRRGASRPTRATSCARR